MQKVQAGQSLRIPAATFNNFIDAAEDYRRRTTNIDSTQHNKRHNTIPIKNASGAAIAPHRILGIEDGLLTEGSIDYETQVAFEGVTPDEAKHVGRWAVVTQGAAAGEITQCVAHGLVIALVDIIDENHKYVEMEDGSTTLVSAAAGSAEILYLDATGGIGEVMAAIRIGSGVPYVYEATADEDEGEITAKLIDSTGTVVGNDITFLVLPD